MYSKAFRALMIQKMTDPQRPAAQSLVDEAVCQGARVQSAAQLLGLTARTL